MAARLPDRAQAKQAALRSGCHSAAAADARATVRMCP